MSDVAFLGGRVLSGRGMRSLGGFLGRYGGGNADLCIICDPACEGRGGASGSVSCVGGTYGRCSVPFVSCRGGPGFAGGLLFRSFSRLGSGNTSYFSDSVTACVGGTGGR